MRFFFSKTTNVLKSVCFRERIIKEAIEIELDRTDLNQGGGYVFVLYVMLKGANWTAAEFAMGCLCVCVKWRPLELRIQLVVASENYCICLRGSVCLVKLVKAGLRGNTKGMVV